jgi:hypothetical protein
MTTFIVHIYREMRLSYTGIEADTSEAAAAIARDKPTADADDIDECDGETFAALVDVAGDEDHEQSVTIDFETERHRKAAPKLLEALEAVLPYAQSEHASLFECWRRDGESVSELEAERCDGAIDKATAALAEAEAAGITPAPAEPEIHALLASRRQIAHIWSIEDVQGIRPDLDGDQAWEVLQNVNRHKDAELGITWLTLEMEAEHLFGDAPETDQAEEA